MTPAAGFVQLKSRRRAQRSLVVTVLVGFGVARSTAALAVDPIPVNPQEEAEILSRARPIGAQLELAMKSHDYAAQFRLMYQMADVGSPGGAGDALLTRTIEQNGRSRSSAGTRYMPRRKQPHEYGAAGNC